MGKRTPISRRVLVARLHRLGFEGPFPGGRHSLMARGNVTVAIPNPHQGDIAVDLLSRVLRKAGISKEEWDSAD